MKERSIETEMRDTKTWRNNKYKQRKQAKTGKQEKDEYTVQNYRQTK